MSVVALISSVDKVTILTMQKPDTWYAYFHVRGSFIPEDITRRVGVAPTQTAREGDAIGNTTKKRPYSLGALHSRLESGASLEEHVKDVLDQLDTNRESFTELSREFGGTMQLVGYFCDVNPSVGFDAEIVRRKQTTAFVLIVTFTTVEKSR